MFLLAGFIACSGSWVFRIGSVLGFGAWGFLGVDFEGVGFKLFVRVSGLGRER